MNIDQKGLFYFDAEWVPIAKSYADVEVKYPALYDAWENKCKKWNNELELSGQKQKRSYDLWLEKAHWYPEYCKMICISFGYFNEDVFEVKSVYGHDELEILKKFQHVLNRVAGAGFILCGYGIKRFDMPWISKRMVVNGLVPPKNISVYGQKPWDVNVFDLPEVWGQGCKQEEYTPFEWVCAAVGIESSKDDISGADVERVYYEEGESGLERIKEYCEKDVMVTKNLASKLIDLLP